MINNSPKRHNNPHEISDQKNMANYTGYDLDPKLLLLKENSDEFKKLPAETKAKIRLAKANRQINKNSSKVDKNETINQDLE